MRDYRACIIGSDGRDVGLWQRDRKIGKFEQEKKQP
jgi:hypothetical protein